MSRRRHPVAKSDPPIWPTDHPDRPRWIHTGLLCLARSRPSNDGRKPLGRETVSKASSRAGFPTQWPALSKSAGLASSLLHLMIGRRIPPQQHRRAAATNVCVRSGRASHRRQAIPDRLSFCRKKRKRLADSVTAPLLLCAFASLRFLGRVRLRRYPATPGQVGALRLRVLFLGGRVGSGSIWMICG